MATEFFAQRHIGPTELEQKKMLKALGLSSLNELVDKAVPPAIRFKHKIKLPPPQTEAALLNRAYKIIDQNKPGLCCMGQGYYGTHMPSVIERQVLENPSWYTAYTPYQAEISQGRLEALLNFQHLIVELTGMQVANSSLLDEGSALAEATQMGLRGGLRPFTSRTTKMGGAETLSRDLNKGGAEASSRDLNKDSVESTATVFVDHDIFISSQRVLQTRMQALSVQVQIGNSTQLQTEDFKNIQVLVLQYPRRTGELRCEKSTIQKARAAGCFVVVAADLLALTLVKEPGQWGVQAVVGSSQRFGVPMGYGGPSAAFLASLHEYKRQLPGRVVGVSHDVHNNRALRLALQTREQHIRRERATSNICTAQVLPAVLASMYAVYHGPKGLKQIAQQVHQKACMLAQGLQKAGFPLQHQSFFDTVAVRVEAVSEFVKKLDQQDVLVSQLNEQHLVLSVDEITSIEDVNFIIECFQKVRTALAKGKGQPVSINPTPDVGSCIPKTLQRQSSFCRHEVFHQHHSESKMLRYMASLEAKDLSLTHSMIPLGSCTMKLNAASELKLLSARKLNLHPHTPPARATGYQTIIQELSDFLCELTGFKACSLQPNSGAQGELLGLLMIKNYHQQQGQQDRQVCLIPQSAHGTNPASAQMAGFQVVQVRCNEQGNIDVHDLKTKAQQHQARLACLMLTYPSTYGVFESTVCEVIECVHQHGGQVYMDGANLNALVGIGRPADWGMDVGHINLHKTFCIPHGGGGPGVGPVLAAEHLKSFLPSTRVADYAAAGADDHVLRVTSSPFGSASILPISWAYIVMMGAEGLARATRVALLNANYIVHRLAPHYPILYRGQNGFVAHECIVDVRSFRRLAGVSVDDVAKRLMDYGFHAPTMSWPVVGGLMIEPTESESLDELDRFCDAMISIRREVDEIAAGKMQLDDNVLCNAPHSYGHLMQSKWTHCYDREKAGFALPYLRDNKFHIPVGRIDNAGGDRNFCCTLDF